MLYIYKFYCIYYIFKGLYAHAHGGTRVGHTLVLQAQGGTRVGPTLGLRKPRVGPGWVPPWACVNPRWDLLTDVPTD